MPETTCMPWLLIARIESRIGTARFCFLSMPRKASGSGVSIPQKIVSNPASRMSARTSGVRAMLRVASQAKLSG